MPYVVLKCYVIVCTLIILILEIYLNINSYIDGNFFFIDVYANHENFYDKEKLKSFIKHYNVKYLLITPWLDYSNFNFYKNKKYSRDEAKVYIKK